MLHETWVIHIPILQQVVNQGHDVECRFHENKYRSQPCSLRSWRDCVWQAGRERVSAVGRRARHAVPLRGRGRCCSTLTMNSRSQERPSQTGVRGQAFFTRQPHRNRRRCEECLTWLPSASALVNESPGYAVGRRGHFSQGADSSRFL